MLSSNITMFSLTATSDEQTHVETPKHAIWTSVEGSCMSLEKLSMSQWKQL